MKKAVLDWMRRTGAFTPFRLANRNKALILMYHRFSHFEGREATLARAFRSHLEYLTKHYHLVPLSRLAALLADGRGVPPGLAAITIDDGYHDTYEVALPLLRRYQAPASLFVVTDFIDRKKWLWTDKLRFMMARTEVRSLDLSLGDFSARIELPDAQSRQQAAAAINARLKTLPEARKEAVILDISRALGVALPDEPPDEFSPLSWDEVRELDAAGVEVGSHTVTHPILTRVEVRQLRHELTASKARLEEMLGRPVPLFCYPNGNYNERVVREVERAGYDVAVSSDYGMNGLASSPLLLRRISAENDLSRFVQSTSGFDGARIKLRSARFPHAPTPATEGARSGRR